MLQIKRSLSLLIFLFFIMFFVFTFLAENEWPIWRGPGMLGISAEGNPPVTWSETENIKWKVRVEGDGSNSSPIVWGDRIFFQTAVKTDKEGPVGAETAAGGGRRRGPGGQPPRNLYRFTMVCLDRTSGKTIWEKTVCQAQPHEGHHGDHGFVSFTPATDGKLLWGNYGSQGVYCFDLDGHLKWSRDLGKMRIRAGFGEGGSLALSGDLVIVLQDHEGDSFIVALKKDTGEVVWKKDRDEKTSWTTPLVVEVGGRSQVIVTGHNRTVCYEATSGEVIWECGGGQTQNVVPTPVTGLGMVFCTSGFRGAKMQAIKLDSRGDVTGTDAVAWEADDGTPYVPSPLLYGDKLYFFSGFRPQLSCYNAKTGRPYYTKHELGEMSGVYASPAGAAGRVYIVGRNGVTYVLKNTETPEVLAINKLDDEIDCSPAIIGDEMYLKGKRYFYCIAETK